MWLFYGAKGFVGSILFEAFQQRGIPVKVAKNRLDSLKEVEAELLELKPERVICCIGRTCGGNYNTIEYLESGSTEITKLNVGDNLFAPVSLGLICARFGIHMTYIGTGCIYQADDFSIKAKEEDPPNFFGSNYSVVKGYTDSLLRQEPLASCVLNLRIRMPVTEKPHPRDFVTKILGYSKIASFPNSITVLPEMIPHMISMIQRGIVGTINCTNPGGITLNQVLKLYRKIVNPKHQWTLFTEEELAEIRKKRSNIILDTSLLEKLCPEVLGVNQALISVFTGKGYSEKS